MSWHDLKDLQLENRWVRLRRITLHDHEAFARIAFDEDTWRYFVTRVTTPKELDQFIEEAIRDTLTGARIVFAIVDRKTGRIVGSTAFGNLSERERKLEIGWSWVAREARGTGINRAAKLALLEHAFGVLGCERVEFKTDVLNTGARRGLAGIGAREEGVLRSFNYMPGGRRRDAIYYSILRAEWPEVRASRFAAYVARTEECSIEAGAERLAATKVIAPGDPAPSVLAIHGTGVKATRARIRYVLDHLAEHGVSSLCFDFSGHGDSTGKLDLATLAMRRAEAAAAAGLLDGQPPRALIGTSMGAHIAALLTPTLKPRSLVLFCPAAYPEAAMAIPFGGGFAEVAKQPRAYVGSPAFQAMRSFTGNLLVVAGGRDTVVPSEVADLYLDSAPQARTKKLYRLDDAEHAIHGYLEQHPDQRAAVLRDIVAAIDPAVSDQP